MNMTIHHDIKGIALITGASSGIGKAIAIAMAKKGYDLVLVGRTESELEQTAEECKSIHPCKAITYAVDLSDLDAVHKMIVWLEQSKFEIEVLVNNAGFGLMSSFINSDLNTELDMINVHIKTPLILMKYVLPKMAKRNIGFIMNVSSIYAFGSVPFQSVYGATKSFLNSFSFALREELKDSGISVTTVCPGSTSTRFRRFLRSETEAAKGMDASIVAQQACKDLFDRKVVSIAGRINQFYFYILWIFPATSLAVIVRKINHKRGMNQSSTH